MRRLSDDEYQALKPFGIPGEWASEATLQALIRDGFAHWVPSRDGEDDEVLEPTEAGLRALRIEEILRGMQANET